MKRPIALGAGVTLAAAVAAVALWPSRSATDPAVRHAQTACEHIGAFEKIVQHNGSADSANRELATARALTGKAAARNPRWVPLDSGVQTLQRALVKDDAAAADIGTRIVRAQCALVPKP